MLKMYQNGRVSINFYIQIKGEGILNLFVNLTIFDVEPKESDIFERLLQNMDKK
jgi:hypothetical protein